MKKLIVFAAAAMMASPALASKARVNALGNSRQLTDVQYVFDRPYLLHSVGEQVTMEWGDKGAANPKAEAGIIKNMGEGVFGLYLGRTGFLSENATFDEQNPINLLYGAKAGDIAWGANLAYSNGKDDANDDKASSMDLTVGATNGVWEAELGMDLGSKSEDNAVETKVKSNMRLGVGYNIDETKHAYLTYGSSEIDGGAKVTDTQLGFINTVAKTEEANLFYSVAYEMNKVDGGVETTVLPVAIGIEAAATSWMTMRASVSQSILINEEKAANGDKEDLDSIVFAAGAGFKLGKGMLDATFATGNAGHLSFGDGATDEFLSSVSYTYMF